MRGVIDGHRAAAAALRQRAQSLRLPGRGGSVRSFASELENWAEENERYAEQLAEWYCR